MAAGPLRGKVKGELWHVVCNTLFNKSILRFIQMRDKCIEHSCVFLSYLFISIYVPSEPCLYYVSRSLRALVGIATLLALLAHLWIPCETPC